LYSNLLPGVMSVTQEVCHGIPAPPTRPPPVPPSLQAPRLVGPLPSDALVLCFAFGKGVSSPGPVNAALAALVATALDGHRVRKVLAQEEIAEVLEQLGQQVDGSTELPPGSSYISTFDVLAAFASEVPPVLESTESCTCCVSRDMGLPHPRHNHRRCTPAVIVAHPDHAWRCWALATLVGYSAKVLDPGSVPGFRWEDHGCDGLCYAACSEEVAHGQEHTTCPESFLPYETHVVANILEVHPELSLSQGA